MASESLSQNEIDLLFDGGEGGTAVANPPTDDVEVQVYDFRRPARISKDRRRSLEAMYGLLAKSLESWIAGRVRDSVQVDLESVEQLTFGEFVLALPTPCASYLVGLDPEKSHRGVIDFGREFAFFLVDRLMGGSGPPIMPERGLTPLERRVVKIVAEQVSQHLTEVWQDHLEMSGAIEGFESIPEMLQVANREDPVLVANLAILVGEIETAVMICLPFHALEKFFTGSTEHRKVRRKGTAEERRRERASLEGRVRTASLLVGARLPTFHVELGDLTGLGVGSVLPTGLPTDVDLQVHIAGQRRFRASPGRVGTKLAFRVTDVVEPDPREVEEASEILITSEERL